MSERGAAQVVRAPGPEIWHSTAGACPGRSSGTHQCMAGTAAAPTHPQRPHLALRVRECIPQPQRRHALTRRTSSGEQHGQQLGFISDKVLWPCAKAALACPPANQILLGMQARQSTYACWQQRTSKPLADDRFWWRHSWMQGQELVYKRSSPRAAGYSRLALLSSWCTA